MYKPGMRLKSAACATEVVIVKAPSAGELNCGGVPMAADADSAGASPQAGWDAGTELGKRYSDADSGLEVLVVKPGAGSLGIDGRALSQVTTKPLPASD